MKIEVRDRQSLMDIALECCGMADAVYKKTTPDGDDVYIVPLTALKP